MTTVFLDASAVAKRYVVEPGTDVVNSLFQRVPRDRMVCLTLATLEVISIFVRKRNAKAIPPAAMNQALADFRKEIIDAPEIRKIPATDGLVNAAATLVARHSLNATDSLILRASLDVAAQLRLSGDDLLLVTCDQRLLRAARAEGLPAFDPEAQDPADLDVLLGSA